ncbi:OadG family protein [Frisingicoccus sp.]|uniref:OadG family protein n=1 Tax=Frisingicoccus sp. TaxID=1918627 RepID=UPI002A81E79E|nr:OadG family protein [Frisingicoccus sp.]MDY4921880.1 OadG family protein [Frisingicoccus sp.]
MKKVLSALLMVMVIISCTACGQDMGSIMQNAAMNTLMGMGTVFFVLVLISIIIYGFSFIGKMQNKVPAKEEKPEPALPAAEEEELCDDLELVAVIAAAIAAYEDVPADSFVVRSIRRKKTADRWKNA